MDNDRPRCQRSGHSMGELEIAAMCGLSPILNRQHGVMRAAVVSRAFHALCAEEPGALRQMALLTPQEQAEVSSWQKPTDVVLPNKVVLDYPSAAKEVWLALDDWGMAVDPHTTEDCLTLGRMDFGWVAVVGDHRIAYVADIKRSIRTGSADPESLQLHCYGLAFAQQQGCTHYCTGIWAAMEGEWIWSRDMVELGSEQAMAAWDRIQAAATNTSDRAVYGGHCSGCYSRSHCPEYLLPAAFGETDLAPVANGATELTEEAAIRCLRMVERMELLADRAKEQLKALVADGRVRIVNEDGDKEWKPCPSAGREYVSVQKLRQEMGEDAERYIGRSKPSTSFRWVKV